MPASCPGPGVAPPSGAISGVSARRRQNAGVASGATCKASRPSGSRARRGVGAEADAPADAGASARVSRARRRRLPTPPPGLRLRASPPPSSPPRPTGRASSPGLGLLRERSVAVLRGAARHESPHRVLLRVPSRRPRLRRDALRLLPLLLRNLAHRVIPLALQLRLADALGVRSARGRRGGFVRGGFARGGEGSVEAALAVVALAVDDPARPAEARLRRVGLLIRDGEVGQHRLGRGERTQRRFPAKRGARGRAIGGESLPSDGGGGWNDGDRTRRERGESPEPRCARVREETLTGRPSTRSGDDWRARAIDRGGARVRGARTARRTSRVVHLLRVPRPRFRGGPHGASPPPGRAGLRRGRALLLQPRRSRPPRSRAARPRSSGGSAARPPSRESRARTRAVTPRRRGDPRLSDARPRGACGK